MKQHAFTLATAFLISLSPAPSSAAQRPKRYCASLLVQQVRVANLAERFETFFFSNKFRLAEALIRNDLTEIPAAFSDLSLIELLSATRPTLILNLHHPEALKLYLTVNRFLRQAELALTEQVENTRGGDRTLETSRLKTYRLLSDLAHLQTFQFYSKNAQRIFALVQTKVVTSLNLYRLGMGWMKLISVGIADLERAYREFVTLLPPVPTSTSENASLLTDLHSERPEVQARASHFVSQIYLALKIPQFTQEEMDTPSPDAGAEESLDELRAFLNGFLLTLVPEDTKGILPLYPELKFGWSQRGGLPESDLDQARTRVAEHRDEQKTLERETETRRKPILVLMNLVDRVYESDEARALALLKFKNEIKRTSINLKEFAAELKAAALKRENYEFATLLESLNE